MVNHGASYEAHWKAGIPSKLIEMHGHFRCYVIKPGAIGGFLSAAGALRIPPDMAIPQSFKDDFNGLSSKPVRPGQLVAWAAAMIATCLNHLALTGAFIAVTFSTVTFAGEVAFEAGTYP